MPETWASVAELAAQPGTTTALIGSSDSGKTTLGLWLAERLTDRGLRAAMIDADVGQSRLGPPATIGWAWGVQERPRGLRFAGDVTPSGVESRCLAAVAACGTEVAQVGAGAALLDTTGWIDGSQALDYKLAKLDLLGAKLCVLVEREGELQPYRRALRGRGSTQVISVRSADAIRRRCPEDRRARRQRTFAQHFADAVEVLFDLRSVGVVGVTGIRERTLLGLLDDQGRLLALGLAHALDPRAGTLTCFAPPAGASAAMVVTGRIALDQEFADLRYGAQ